MHEIGCSVEILVFTKIENSLSVKLGKGRQRQLCYFPQKSGHFRRSNYFFNWFQFSTFHYSYFGPSFYLAEFSLYVFTKISKGCSHSIKAVKWTLSSGQKWNTDLVCVQKVGRLCILTQRVPSSGLGLEPLKPRSLGGQVFLVLEYNGRNDRGWNEISYYIRTIF